MDISNTLKKIIGKKEEPTSLAVKLFQDTCCAECNCKPTENKPQ